MGGADDGFGVDAVVAVEIGDGAGLAEVLDAERADAMAVNAAEPSERRGMAVEDGDESAIRRHGGEQTLDMRAGADEALFAGALRGSPAGVEAIG